jgi:hypothetical protein
VGIEVLTCHFSVARDLSRGLIVLLCLAATRFLQLPSTFPMATDAVVLDASEPSLTLSDIIHTVSPTPSPQLDGEARRPHTPSPEPLTEAEIVQMRRRVTEMGFSSTSKGLSNANPREKELVDMVCVGVASGT